MIRSAVIVVLLIIPRCSIREVGISDVIRQSGSEVSQPDIPVTRMYPGKLPRRRMSVLNWDCSIVLN